MLDPRPVGYIIGWIVVFFGSAMTFPILLEILDASDLSYQIIFSMVATLFAGAVLILTCANRAREGLSIQQTFYLTTGIWFILPLFGALPIYLALGELRFLDAFFEAVSGLTTTGATILSDLDTMPRGILLWRGMLQWAGGIGIIIFAMVFLPELRLGGMQIFRSEGFDTLGKILPRAVEIARSISVIYLGLTFVCAVAYLAAGLDPFTAMVHAMTTIATGGFANFDLSFTELGQGVEYTAIIFMILAALPFLRYVQLLSGANSNIFGDAQVRGFLGVICLLGLLCVAIAAGHYEDFEIAFRKGLFNATSLLTGTGFASADYTNWGDFAIIVLFSAGLIGGCAGSTSCSIKVFRFQILFGAIRVQLQRIEQPSGVFYPKYQGRRVSEEVIKSVIAFFILFILSFCVLALGLSLTGLDLMTSISGSAAALSNIGPGFGSEIGPMGNYAGLNDMAKILLIMGMLVGRLEMLAVFVFFTRAFWSA